MPAICPLSGVKRTNITTLAESEPMPFMALMAAPLSAMLSVTGGDGSLDCPLSHARVNRR